jgi:hypothetical protein
LVLMDINTPKITVLTRSPTSMSTIPKSSSSGCPSRPVRNHIWRC